MATSAGHEGGCDIWPWRAPREGGIRHPVLTRPVSAGLRTGIDRVSAPLTRAGAADSRVMGVAVLGPLQLDGQAAGLGPRDRVVLSALVLAGEPVGRHACRRPVGGRPPGVVDQGAAGLRGAAAQAAGQRGDRVRARRLPPRPHRGPSSTTGSSSACSSAPGSRWWAAIRRGRPTCAQEALELWRGPRCPTWRSGSPDRSRPAGSTVCGWTPRRCWSRRSSRRPGPGGAGAGPDAGGPGTVPRAALGPAGPGAAPVRAAAGGPRRDPSRRARCWSRSSVSTRAGAGRAGGHAAAPGPLPAPGGVAGTPSPPAPTAACSPTTRRTPTRSSVARTTWRPACDGCATRASWPWSAPRGSASPPWSGPAWCLP